MANERTVTIRIDAMDRASRTFQKLEKQGQQTARSLESNWQKASRTLKNVGSRARTVGRELTTKLSLPLAAVGGAAFKMSNDFNKAMANVGSLIPQNSARVRELKTEVQDLSIEVGKRTGDMAEGLYQVISAFQDSADTAKILEINAKAATAGVASTRSAIDLTSAVTKAYGDTTAEAVQQVSDLALMTVRLGQDKGPAAMKMAA